MNKPTFEQSVLYFAGPVTRYLLRGEIDGGFLQAVLENNLASAVCRADDRSLLHLQNIVKAIYNYVPSRAWGSPAKVNQWVKDREDGSDVFLGEWISLLGRVGYTVAEAVEA